MRALFILTILFAFTTIQAQNVYEIYITSYANARDLKDVKFELFQGGNLVVEQVSSDGLFQFVIKEGDGEYRLKAMKDGFIPKVIQFKAGDYPFINEYEIQEIDIEFHKSTAPEDESEVGDLKWSTIGHTFNVVKVDSAMDFVKENYISSQKSLGEIYVKAIENGDEMMALNQPDYAIPHYELALMAYPNDEYAKKKIQEIKETKMNMQETAPAIDKEMMDKINSGELTEIPKEYKNKDVLYVVQLGAFSKEIKEEDHHFLRDRLCAARGDGGPPYRQQTGTGHSCPGRESFPPDNYASRHCDREGPAGSTGENLTGGKRLDAIRQAAAHPRLLLRPAFDDLEPFGS